MMKYTKNLVAFIDVLGFRELVKSKNLNLIQSYFLVSGKVIEFWKTTEVKQEIQVITMSDSIVISIELPEDELDQEKIKIMREFFIAISLLQGELALNDIWTRGGVSYGDYFVASGRNVMFGPAMIDAYELELKSAKYPRVVIDQNLVLLCGCKSVHEFIFKINKSLASSDEKWRSSILYPWISGRDEINSFRKDYPLFIDYIAQYLNNPEELESIADNLLSSSLKNPNAYEKLKWVGDYMKMRLLFGVDKEVEFDGASNTINSKLDSF